MHLFSFTPTQEFLATKQFMPGGRPQGAGRLDFLSLTLSRVWMYGTTSYVTFSDTFLPSGSWYVLVPSCSCLTVRMLVDASSARVRAFRSQVGHLSSTRNSAPPKPGCELSGLPNRPFLAPAPNREGTAEGDRYARDLGLGGVVWNQCEMMDVGNETSVGCTNNHPHADRKPWEAGG